MGFARHCPLCLSTSFQSSVFKYILPEVRDSVLLCDLIRSFELERPRSHIAPSGWDLVRVLSFLWGSSFEP